jgi:glycosyltransferase involved in cell wall biosynthesis
MKKKLIKQKLKICFVSLNSYPLLVNENLGYVGGAEIQQVELAKELNKRGYKISFITYGWDNTDSKKADGIDIIPVYDRKDANNLSFFKKTLIIWKKMKEIDANIYIYQAGSSGIVSLFGKINQKKIIRLIASDADITSENIIGENNITGLLFKFIMWFDIKLSDVVVSQNEFQKSKLKNRLNVKSIIIKNAFDIIPRVELVSKANYVLWVGTIRSVKQPHLFLKIAEILPEYDFIMIGGKGESLELFRNIKDAADKIPNLDFKGFISHNRIFDYYRKSILFVNTSKTEGFPNVFLEAWMSSTPVVSLNVDPDGIISKYKLGYHSKSFNQMINNIKTLLDDKELCQNLGENARKYVEKNHNIKEITDLYESLIMNF